MDFNKLKEYQIEMNTKIHKLANTFSINFDDLKELCQKISFQTPYSFSDVVSFISCDLSVSLSIEDIKKKYNVRY